MIYELSQTFYFEAAHTLDREVEAEGSKRIHGHTYHAEVVLCGEPDQKSGMVQDLGFVRQEIKKVRDLLDHQFLDNIPELGPATLENLCTFIFSKLQKSLSNVVAVSVHRNASGDKCTLRRLLSLPPITSQNVRATNADLPEMAMS